MAGRFRIVKPSFGGIFRFASCRAAFTWKAFRPREPHILTDFPGIVKPLCREFFDPFRAEAPVLQKAFRPREPIILAGFSRTSTASRDVFRSRPTAACPIKSRRQRWRRAFCMPARDSASTFLARRGRSAKKPSFQPPTAPARSCACPRPARPRNPAAAPGPHLRQPRHRSSPRAPSACGWLRNCWA